MDCEKAIHRIYHYLDGELTMWRRRAIARHLDECPPCAEGFDFELELRQVIASKCRDEVPPELKRRIAEALGAAVPEERLETDLLGAAIPCGRPTGPRPEESP
jgi:mycothiol system anti-sigma-R factor